MRQFTSTILSILPNQTASCYFEDINLRPVFKHVRGHTLPHSTSPASLNIQTNNALETNLLSFNITFQFDRNTLITVLWVQLTNHLHIYEFASSLRLSFSSLLGLWNDTTNLTKKSKIHKIPHIHQIKYFFVNMSYLFWTLIFAGNKKLLFF